MEEKRKKKKVNISDSGIIEYIHEKVTNMGGTFLHEDNDGFKVSSTKMESERLPIWWEPFARI